MKVIVDLSETCNCPNCHTAFRLAEILASGSISSGKEEFEHQVSMRLSEMEEYLRKELKQQAETELNSTRKNMKLQFEGEQQDLMTEINSLRVNIEQQNSQLQEMKKRELNILQKEREIETERMDIQLEVERSLETERTELITKITEQYITRENELKKKIDDAHKLNQDLNKKLQQGSQQLQGEAQELSLEQMLRSIFPLDQIDPVNKGVAGADIIHLVKTKNGLNCGKIIWESKQAKSWSSNWITKIKQDMRDAGGEIGVIVSTVFPSDITRPADLYEGIWLIRPQLARVFAEVFRMALIEKQRGLSIGENKAGMMANVYDYISSTQFSNHIIAVMERAQQMLDELQKERQVFLKTFSKREKHIQSIISEVMGLTGELQGISPSALPSLEQFSSLEQLIESG